MPFETPEQHFVGKVSQRAIISQNGKFLLTLDVGAKKWGAPGGRLHVGEKPLEGLIREVKEELGIDIESHGVIHTEAELYSDGTPVFAIYHLSKLVDPNQSLVLDAVEVSEVGWFSLEQIQEQSLPIWSSAETALRISAE